MIFFSFFLALFFFSLKANFPLVEGKKAEAATAEVPSFHAIADFIWGLTVLYDTLATGRE